MAWASPRALSTTSAAASATRRRRCCSKPGKEACVTPHAIAARLAAEPGLVAVVLGGSQARGTHAPDSDVDLGLYYDPARPPSRERLNALAHELDDRHP